MGSRPHSLFFALSFFFFTPGLNLKDTAEKNTTLKVISARFQTCHSCFIRPSHLCAHVWKFQTTNLLSSRESLWFRCFWKWSAAKRPDLYAFLSCACGFQSILSLCSPTHASHKGGWSALLPVSSACQQKLGQELKQVLLGQSCSLVWFLTVMQGNKTWAANCISTSDEAIN